LSLGPVPADDRGNVAGLNAGRANVGHVHLALVHRNAPDERRAPAGKQNMADVAQAAVQNRPHSRRESGDARRAGQRVRASVADSRARRKVAHEHDTRVPGKRWLDFGMVIVNGCERLDTVQREAGPHERAAHGKGKAVVGGGAKPRNAAGELAHDSHKPGARRARRSAARLRDGQRSQKVSEDGRLPHGRVRVRLVGIRKMGGDPSDAHIREIEAAVQVRAPRRAGSRPGPCPCPP
jgi:hypothetical protein